MFIREWDESEIAILEKKLQRFYAETIDYPVYDTMTWRPEFWSIVVEQMKKTGARSGRFLEIGAAKSGFAEFLKQQGEHFQVAFHDVTDRCRQHLSRYTDDLYFGPVENINDKKYDVIFHSYVFEHLTRPRHLLDCMNELLREGGRHVIESPRYDFPLYMPPAIRHNRLTQKAEYVLKTFLGLYPDFSIVKEPAIFFRKFRRDYDAVHRVTRSGIFNYARLRNMKIEEFGSSEDRSASAVLERNMRLRVVLYKS